MQISDGHVILSPSDLIRFQGCEHATALDLRLLKGEPLAPAPDSAEAVLLQRKGQEHEQRFLSEIGASPEEVVVIDQGAGFKEAARLTREAMVGGAKVIYQGALRFGAWQGYSDFLERVEEPSALGPFGYEAIDTKLKRRVDPKHAIQLGLYSRGVAEIQGRTPTQAHVVLGTAPPSRVPLVVEDLRHYTDRLAARLEAFVAAPWPTEPEPVAACGLCRWREHCTHHWESTDSLTLVAGITRLQRRRLKAAGVTTLADLASLNRRVPRIQPDTLSKLRTQARLQHYRRAGGEPTYELKPVQPGLGLARLPEPSPADLFFDMEGDPLIESGLEYLFGVYHEPCGAPRFRTWWAHDPEEEKAAVLAVLEFFITHLARHRDAFIYHYAPYEVTALKRLTARYCVGEVELDHLLRNKRFVDLYRVVQQGIMASEPSYSLKDLEVFYMPERQGEVLSATDSIITYENWLETGDDTILDEIVRYNEEDCRSTKLLRDWLVAKVRPSSVAWFEPDKKEDPPVKGTPSGMPSEPSSQAPKDGWGPTLPSSSLTSMDSTTGPTSRYGGNISTVRSAKRTI
jgi:predicted RecB family nuclease